MLVEFALVLSIVTGRENIFSARKYGGGGWGHVGGMIMVMIVLPLILWPIGCMIMLAAKKLSGGRQPRAGTVGA